MLCSKIPDSKNVNQSMHVATENFEKTHDGESSRKSPKVRRKVIFANEQHIISIPNGFSEKEVENSLNSTGGKAHSLDVLSNVASCGLLDDVVASIDSDDTSKEIVLKEDTPSSKLPKDESDPSENSDEFEKRCKILRIQGTHMRDPVSLTRLVTLLMTMFLLQNYTPKERKRSMEQTGNLLKLLMLRRTTRIMTMKRILFPKKINLVNLSRGRRNLTLKVLVVPLDGISFHFVDNGQVWQYIVH